MQCPDPDRQHEIVQRFIVHEDSVTCKVSGHIPQRCLTLQRLRPEVRQLNGGMLLETRMKHLLRCLPHGQRPLLEVDEARSCHAYSTLNTCWCLPRLLRFSELP